MEWKGTTETGYRLKHVKPEGTHRAQLITERDQRSDDLEFWREFRDEQISRGEATNYGPETIAKGDLVQISGHWHRVARVNKKSVSVETGYSWTDRAPYAKVTDHRPAA